MAFFYGRIGGTVEGGSATSNSAQSASVNFIPSQTDNSAPPIVSAYPAGQGLATLNNALPGSAAYLPSTYAGSAPASSPLTVLVIIAALGVGAWLLLKGKR
jgi:hypothetical protein